MKSKAIIGETPEVYFIDKDILQYLNYTYLTGENDVLVATGFQYFMKHTFDVVEIDGIEYDWISGGVVPNTPKKEDYIKEYMLVRGIVYKFNERQLDTLEKLIDGTYICSVSEYRRNEESYQRRMREKKMDRIVHHCEQND